MRELTLETNLNGNLTKLFANTTRVWSCMTFSGVLCRPRIITGHHGPGTGGLLSQTMTSLKKKKSEKETIPLTTNSRPQLIKRQRRQLRAIETPTIFAEFLFTCILIRIFSQRIQKHLLLYRFKVTATLKGKIYKPWENRGLLWPELQLVTKLVDTWDSFLTLYQPQKVKIIIPSHTSSCNVVPHFELHVGNHVKHHNLQWCGVGGAWIVLFSEVILNKDGASLIFSQIVASNEKSLVSYCGYTLRFNIRM